MCIRNVQRSILDGYRKHIIPDYVWNQMTNERQERILKIFKTYLLFLRFHNMFLHVSKRYAFPNGFWKRVLNEIIQEGGNINVENKRKEINSQPEIDSE